MIKKLVHSARFCLARAKATCHTKKAVRCDNIIIKGTRAQIFKDRLLVPKDAILIRDQRKLLFIVRDGLAKWCYVETGLENEKYVEILSSTFDLKPGELVITLVIIHWCTTPGSDFDIRIKARNFFPDASSFILV